MSRSVSQDKLELPATRHSTKERNKLNLFYSISSKMSSPCNSKSPSKSNGKASFRCTDKGSTGDTSASSASLYRRIQSREDYSQKAAASNYDLIILMSQQLHKADNELAKVKQLLVACEENLSSKDLEISALQNKISDLKKELNEEARKKECPCLVYGLPYDKLFNKYKYLEEQLGAMEEFLSDYGLTWVGDRTKKPTPNAVKPETSKPNEMNSSTWNPETSVEDAIKYMEVNFDELLQRINELNAVAGEGETQLCFTKNGATFQRKTDTLPLTIHSNGILLSEKFRDFSEPATWYILQDIFDGYFPHELQKDFPDGVIFQVHDKRDTKYEEPKTKWKAFSGVGYRLGRKSSANVEVVPSKSAPTAKL